MKKKGAYDWLYYPEFWNRLISLSLGMVRRRLNVYE